MKGALLLATLCAPDADALAALAGDVGAASRAASPVKVLERVALDAKEPSGVAVLPDGSLLVVDDEKGLFLHRTGEGGVRVDVTNGSRLDGPEGIAVSPDGRTAWVVSEDDRTVHAIGLSRDGSRAKEPRKIGKLPVLGGRERENKGWEGIAFLPAALDPDGRDRLVAVHEGRPRRIGLFDAEDLGNAVLLDLPEEIEEGLEDLSDVAIDPLTGNLLLLSDRSAAIGEVSLRGRRASMELRVERLSALPFAAGKHPEGLAFAADGTLWIITEGDRTATRIRYEVFR